MAPAPLPTRRALLKAGAAAGLTLSVGSRRALGADFQPPAGSCDCHVHVIGDAARYPMSAARAYTPPQATPEMLLRFHRALGLDRVVLVQPSVYGTDNTALLDGLAALGDRARAVAVIKPDEDESTLNRLREAGVRGLRLNIETGGALPIETARDRFRALLEPCRRLGWHIQIYSRPGTIAALSGEIEMAGVPIVLDHFAGTDAASGVAQPGLDTVLTMVKAGTVWVKLSAPYRISRLGPPYPDVVPIAEAFVAANPRRLLWASDWPHTNSILPAGSTPQDLSPDLPIDDSLVLRQLARWAPDRSVRHRILVDNPAALYGFGPSEPAPASHGARP